MTPVFSTDDGRPLRLLLLSYHFPPDAAIGARRWEKMARYAAERGWGVDAISCGAGTLTEEQRTRLQRTLPAGVRIFQVPMPTLPVERLEASAASWYRTLRSRAEPRTASQAASKAGGAEAQPENAPAAAPKLDLSGTSIAREEVRWGLGQPRGWLRMYWAWLEHAQYAAWGREALRMAQPIVQAHRAKGGRHIAVIASGPPHPIHDTGRQVAEATGLPFVMDMRDPWSCVERLGESVATPLWMHMADHYESRAVDRATLVVANTDVARDRLWARYPARRGDIITAMNGADDDPLPPPTHARRFSIAHAGTIYLDRDPRPLFQAAARVIRELQLTPEQFGLDFIGEFTAVNGYPIEAVARQEGIENYVHVGPSLPYAKAMEFMAGATMLLTMSGTSIAAIPAKTFECVRFQAWLLALSAPGSATERVLRGTEADVAASGDTDAIAAILKRRYEQHAAGILPPMIGTDDRFSRRRQAQILLDAIAERVPLEG